MSSRRKKSRRGFLAGGGGGGGGGGGDVEAGGGVGDVPMVVEGGTVEAVDVGTGPAGAGFAVALVEVGATADFESFGSDDMSSAKVLCTQWRVLE